MPTFLLKIGERLRFFIDLLRKGKSRLSLERRASALFRTVKESIESVGEISIQYVEIRDAETLEKIEIVDGPAVIAVAAIVGSVRLINNIILRR